MAMISCREKDLSSLKKLSLAKLSSILKHSASIVTADLCLPEATRAVFQKNSISLSELNILWEKLRPIVDGFNGNAEKFYAKFYGLLTENLMPSKFDTIYIYQHFNE